MTGQRVLGDDVGGHVQQDGSIGLVGTAKIFDNDVDARNYRKEHNLVGFCVFRRPYSKDVDGPLAYTRM